MKDKQASSTALAIAASLVFMHNHPRYAGAVPDIAANFASRILDDYSGRSKLLLRILRRPWFRSIAATIERATVGGILRHYAMRKKCIALLAREALEAGTRQVIILGAGFDSLSLTLHAQFTNAQFWEVDHPATQRHKTRALDAVERDRLHFLPANLNTIELENALAVAPDFEIGKKTLWIAEGLLMYFTESTGRRLLEQASRMSGPGSRFVFTFMEADGDGRVRFRNQTRLLDWWLRLQGESFRWGARRENIRSVISPWRVLRIYDETDLRKLDSGTGEVKLAVGELICLAEI